MLSLLKHNGTLLPEEETKWDVPNVVSTVRLRIHRKYTQNVQLIWETEKKSYSATFFRGHDYSTVQTEHEGCVAGKELAKGRSIFHSVHCNIYVWFKEASFIPSTVASLIAGKT